ncbi:MAG: 4-oxalocrotonate tautomerase family protein [Deltaproteobacteria bacterium]|nr:4-oxalocrotonate tautomerase family protein [Deltaproteobacteria bacterium]
MPYVNLKLIKGVTREQKKELVHEITLLLQRVLNKKPEHTHIVIDEVEPDDWGFSGMLTSDWMQERKG